MANLAFLNVYQINQTVLNRDQSQRIGFPTQGCLVEDCSGSPTRSLSSGYNVYGLIIVPSPGAANSNGTLYYVGETVAQLALIFG
jgi:hypothetical protein